MFLDIGFLLILFLIVFWDCNVGCDFNCGKFIDEVCGGCCGGFCGKCFEGDCYFYKVVF